MGMTKEVKVSNTIVVVDGFSTGRFLADEFRRLGCRILHVSSCPAPPRVLKPSFRPMDYDRVVPWSSDVGSLVKTLAAVRPDAIVAGCDTGVYLADLLADRLGLPGNPPTTSCRRRDKYLMVQAMRFAGFPVPAQIKSDNLNRLLRWAKRLDRWPIVVKPLEGAGSQGVAVCRSPDDLTRAFAANIAAPNLLDIENREVVAQSYVDGTQLVVNTITLAEGIHYVTDVWRVALRDQPGRAIERIGLSLLVGRGHPLPLVQSFAGRVLDTLDVRFGAGNIDLRITSDGPVLLELNARVMGATMNRGALDAALGFTHASALAMSVTCPWDFDARFGAGYGPRRRLEILNVDVATEGIVVARPGLSRIASLASFLTVDKLPAIGDRVAPAGDTTGRNGFVYLSHEDEIVLERDRALVRELIEAGHLLEIAPLRAAETIGRAVCA